MRLPPHAPQVIHCDVKPANLVLQRTGDFNSARLTDFGLSHQLTRSGWAATPSRLKAVGTPLYFAPEMISMYLGAGSTGFGREVDVWGAGVVMYELLCGRKPFSGQDTAALFANIASQRPSTSGPPWDTVSEEAKELLHLCLAKDRRERISAAHALKHRWFADSAAGPGGAAPARSPSAMQRALSCGLARLCFHPAPKRATRDCHAENGAADGSSAHQQAKAHSSPEPLRLLGEGSCKVAGAIAN